MARPAGSTNADHDEKRTALARAVAEHLRTSPQATTSLRGLAGVAGVSVPTLRHYFNDLDGVLIAAYEELKRQGDPWLAIASQPDALDLGPSLRHLMEQLRFVMADMGLIRVHATGMSLGFGHESMGPAYLDLQLEPIVLALEARMRTWQDLGVVREGDVRTAALGLLSPLVVAVLHQTTLGGDTCRPLDMGAFLDSHVEAFVRAWGRSAAST